MRKLALCVVLASGCAQTDSTDLLSSGISASLVAGTVGDGVTNVHGTLFVGNPINLNFVDLMGGDQLIASHNGQDKVMSEAELLNIVGYHAQFTGDEEGLEFEIAFVRTIDAGAPSSRATLPAKFEIETPPASASRAAPLTLTWSPASTLDRMSWQAEGMCIETATGSIPADPGSVVIAGDTIKKRMGDMVPDTCEVTLTIIRSRAGQLDRGYGKGGTIQGQQTRSVKLSSTP
jgi:hypothetical protein